ncbi:MAG: hypothetical protein ACRD6B_17875 [Bryobacteraceae bacterium]
MPFREERDRPVALKKAKKKLITQKQAAAEMGLSERQVRRLLRSEASRRQSRAARRAGPAIESQDWGDRPARSGILKT